MPGHYSTSGNRSASRTRTRTNTVSGRTGQFSGGSGASHGGPGSHEGAVQSAARIRRNSINTSNDGPAYQGPRHRDAHYTGSGASGDQGRTGGYGGSGSSGGGYTTGSAHGDAVRNRSQGGDDRSEERRRRREAAERERKRREEEEARRAEEERLRILGETKASAISGADAFGHGDAAEKYVAAYQQRLADAYDAAQTGVGRSILEAGYATGDEYSALEDAKAGQEAWLNELGQNYQSQAKSEYDRWLQENTDAINALGTKEAVDAYNWTGADYDLDLTGGKAFGGEGEYDADYIPEFYEGFRKEFDQDYSDPTMPDEWGGHEEVKKKAAADKQAKQDIKAHTQPGGKWGGAKPPPMLFQNTASRGGGRSSQGSARYF